MPTAWSMRSGAAWREAERARDGDAARSAAHADAAIRGAREPIPGPWRPTTRPSRPQLPAGATPPQLAAWTAVARVLLNLDETITKE